MTGISIGAVGAGIGSYYTLKQGDAESDAEKERLGRRGTHAGAIIGAMGAAVSAIGLAAGDDPAKAAGEYERSNAYARAAAQELALESPNMEKVRLALVNCANPP